MNMLEIGHTEIYVSDALAAKDFYVDILGFELDVIQAGKFVWLKKGTQSVLLKSGRKAPTPNSYQDAPSAIVLYTNDLPSTAEILKRKGLKFLGTDGSPNCLTFTDPDGNWFQLVDPKDHH
jgi:catechol 2,3-dioxygenase-like lactoylglutathione lyase family enzyme